MEPSDGTGTSASSATAPHVIERLVEGRQSLDGVAQGLQPLAEAVRGRGGWRTVVTGEVMGHAAHPFLTDLPLGLFTSASLLDLVGGPRSEAAARRLVGAGLLCAPAAAVTGLAEYASLSERPRRVAVTHALLNTASLGLYAASWALRPRRRGAGVVLGLAGMTMSGVAGYLGGHLAIGEKVGTTTTPAAPPDAVPAD
jgi:uncharacterized membrane protein